MGTPNIAGWRSIVFLMLLVTSAAVFIVVPIRELASFPATEWIVAQPQSWQGGLEGIALALLLVASQRLNNGRWRFIAVAVLSELYLRRHGADTAIFIDVVFVEILIALGGSIQYWIAARRTDGTEKYLRNFLLGLLVWSACAWLLSALDHGSLKELRALSLILAIVGFSTRPQLFSVFVYRRIAVTPFVERCAYAALFAWFLMLCAKTDTTVGFDPLWYGLRGDLVLLDHGSVYHSLGLVSAVHYFPKLYEMLLLPVSGIGSSSVISGVSVMMFVLIAATAHALARRLGIERWEVRIAAIAACVTLPAIANTALDPKPDTLAALLLLIGWLNASEFVETRKLSAAFWSVSGLILATQAKLTALPFSTMIALAAAWLVLRERQRQAAHDSVPERRIAITVFVLSIIVTAFVTARTIVLAGMPTIGPDAFFHLWTRIGFELRPPAGTLGWTSIPNWEDIPQLAIDLLFRPQLLEHILVAWTGNIWLWCGIVFLAASLLWRFEKIPSNATLTIGKSLMLSGLLVMFGIGYGVRGSDGNYFIAPLVPAILIGANSFSRSLALRSMTRTIGIACFFAFVAFQATYSFLSASWAPGTHGFDLNYHRGIHDFRKYNRSLMLHSGLGTIEPYLRHLHRAARVLDCVDESISMRLPARVESVETVAYSRREYVASQAAFLDFIVRDKIEFLIVPNGDDAGRCSRFPSVMPAIRSLIDNPSVTSIPDVNYTMYDLSRYVPANAAPVPAQR
jgi:hypothetical protein